jgi:D-glycero-alpha-D-manno-heptose 1-phosphate guanylyltransferase
MKLLILAGGFGTRLQSAVAAVPKALAPVGGVPFLRLQLEHWIDQGLRSFVFLLHHQSAQVIDFLLREKEELLKNCELDWLVEPAPMGTGGALAYAVERLDMQEDFLVTNADTWLGGGIEAMRRAGSPSMAVVQVSDAARYGSVLFDNDGVVRTFREIGPNESPGWINAGLCRLNAGLFRDWTHAPFSLEQISFPAWAAHGQLKAVPLQVDFIDIGIPEDYFRFCRWIESQKARNL